MKHISLITRLVLVLVALLPVAAHADSARQIDSKVSRALRQLIGSNPTARALSKSAQGVLVFPDIVKAGFLVAGQYGEGAMIEEGETVGYYNIASGSFGFQAGATKYGLALFFMDNSSLAYLKRSRGWEIGAGPTVVLMDQGFMKSFSSTTLRSGVYACFFNETGLMAGAGLQGTKITRIYPR